MERQLHLVDRLPQRLPHRVPHRLHVPGAGELEPLDAHLGDPVDLFDRVVDVAIGQAGKPDLALRVVPAELLEPIVVDAQHLVRRFAVVEARGGAEDAVHHLGIDAVALHVLDAQMRVGAAADILLAVLVHPGLGHLVDPVVLTGDEGRAARARRRFSARNWRRSWQPIAGPAARPRRRACGPSTRGAPPTRTDRAASTACRDGNRPKFCGIA